MEAGELRKQKLGFPSLQAKELDNFPSILFSMLQFSKLLQELGNLFICMSFSNLFSAILIFPMIFTYHSEALCSQMLSSMFLKYLYILERSQGGVKKVWPESMLCGKREDGDCGMLFPSQVQMSSYDKKDSKLLRHFPFSYSLLSYQKS